MLLEVENLFVEFAPRGEPATHAVRGVSFGLQKGETLGLVGESGSGKSVTALSILRLIVPPGKVSQGRVMLDGQDLLALSEAEMRGVRGGRIAIVFQDPMTALNPVLTVGTQIVETIRAHRNISLKEARDEALGWLERVHIPMPERRLRQYPYELSGGMRQRVMLAIAFCCRPEVLIADEPTTALDVTVQAQVLDLMDEMREELGTAVLLITHDLSIVAERADRVAVMYAGQVVEEAPAGTLFAEPKHPYTQALLASLPNVWQERDEANPLPALPGRPPRLVEGSIPSGCAFTPRCAQATAICSQKPPALISVGAEHTTRCVLYSRESILRK